MDDARSSRFSSVPFESSRRLLERIAVDRKLSRLPFGPRSIHLELNSRAASQLPAVKGAEGMRWLRMAILEKLRSTLEQAEAIVIECERDWQAHPELLPLLSRIRELSRADLLLHVPPTSLADPALDPKLFDLFDQVRIIIGVNDRPEAILHVLERRAGELEALRTRLTIICAPHALQPNDPGLMGLAQHPVVGRIEIVGAATVRDQPDRPDAPCSPEASAESFCFFSQVFITADALVMSCQDERHALGDLETQDFEAIWNGMYMAELRRRWHRTRERCDGCSG